MNRHDIAYRPHDGDNLLATNPGYYHWRDGGEKHMNDPMTIANLQVGQVIFTDLFICILNNAFMKFSLYTNRQTTEKGMKVFLYRIVKNTKHSSLNYSILY